MVRLASEPQSQQSDANGIIAEAVRSYVGGAHNAIWNSAADAALSALREAGFRVLTEKQIDAIHSDGFRQGLHD